jgi:hypothetical protein
VAISHWTSADAARAITNRYAAHPNMIVANELASEPRRLVIGIPDNITGEKAA